MIESNTGKRDVQQNVHTIQVAPDIRLNPSTMLRNEHLGLINYRN
jgi:hypothetical protein